MITSIEFQKEAFANLLIQAKGKRSINEYAAKVNVSAAHISRLSRQLIEAAPTPEIIKRLVSDAENGVTYSDLMQAAGHISDLPNINEESIIIAAEPEGDRRNSDYEKAISNIIVAEMLERGGISNINLASQKCDMSIDYEGDGITRLYFEIRESISISFLRMLYGKLACEDFTDSDQFILVTADLKSYETAENYPPKLLRLNFSIMLIDIDNKSISKEKGLCQR